MNWLQY